MEAVCGDLAGVQRRRGCEPHVCGTDEQLPDGPEARGCRPDEPPAGDVLQRGVDPQSVPGQHGRSRTPLRVAASFLREARSGVQACRDLGATITVENMPVMSSSHRALRRIIRSIIDHHPFVETG